MIDHNRSLDELAIESRRHRLTLFRRHGSTANEVNLVADENDRTVRDPVGAPKGVKEILSHREGSGVGGRIYDAVSVWVVRSHTGFRRHIGARVIDEGQLGLLTG